MFHWLANCVHLTFVVDRIEPPFAIVEWADTAMLTEIQQTHFPHSTREGDTWTLHLRSHRHAQPEAKINANSAVSALSLTAAHHTVRFRLSRNHNASGSNVLGALTRH